MSFLGSQNFWRKREIVRQTDLLEGKAKQLPSLLLQHPSPKSLYQKESKQKPQNPNFDF